MIKETKVRSEARNMRAERGGQTRVKIERIEMWHHGANLQSLHFNAIESYDLRICELDLEDVLFHKQMRVSISDEVGCIWDHCPCNF